jgi:hypothetical protein
VHFAPGFPARRYDRRVPSLLDAVREVVAECAPDELPLVAALGHLPPDEVGKRLANGTSRDDPLGFGMGEVVALVTPIVWTAVQQVVNHMATSAVDGVSTRLRDRLTKRKHRRADAPLPHFGPAEYTEISGTVLEQAVRLGMSPEDAERLSYRVVDVLRKLDPGDGTS